MKTILLIFAIVCECLTAAAQPAQGQAAAAEIPGGVRDFDLRGDAKMLFEAVAREFGLECTFAQEYDAGHAITFRMQRADYRTALHALEAATKSFVVPMSSSRILVDNDTPDKRRANEPDIAVTVELPQATTPQDVSEAARAVQQVLAIQKLGMQTQGNRLVMRGPVSTIVPARQLFDSLLHYRPEVNIEMKLIEVDHNDTVSYGLNLPTSIAISSLSSLNNTTSTLAMLAKGGIGGMFGIGILSAELLAQFQKSLASTLLDLTVRASNHQPSSFHSGNRYPIVTSEYVSGQSTPVTNTNTNNGSNTNNGTNNGTPTAPSPTLFGNVPQPDAVALGDLNADGLIDIVSASQSGDGVGVMFGNTDGTFQDAIIFPVGTAPSAVAIADVNADGKLDVITADAGSNTVSVLLGNGDGTLQSAIHYNVGGHPAALVVADLNRDGIPDIATANSNSNDVSVLLGLKDGGFGDAKSVTVGTGPGGLVAADLNLDGKLDLVTVNLSSNDVTVLLGMGDGTFLPGVSYPTGQSPTAIVSGDLNRDGFPDLVVANSADSTVSVLAGTGTGAFLQGIPYPAGTSPTAAVIGDFNLDGVTDVALANTSSGAISLLLGIGNGSFQLPVAFQTGANPGALAAADVNKDSVPDIVAANASSNNFSLLLGTVGGGFHDSSGNSFTPTGGQLYQPPPAFTYEDLGLVVKVTPHVRRSDGVFLDLEASFKLLSGQSNLGMPIITNRSLATHISVPTGEWAVIGGLMTKSEALSISGLPLASILGKKERDHDDAQVLVLIKVDLLSLGPDEYQTPPISLGSETRPRIPY